MQAFVKKNREMPSRENIYNNPNIVILGGIDIFRKNQDIEGQFNIILMFTDPEGIKSIINKETIAVIVDEKVLGDNSGPYLLKNLKQYSLLPFIYIARTGKSDSFYQKLYAGGLQGVIDWQRNSEALGELIVEYLKPKPKANGVTRADKNLANVVKSQLNLKDSFSRIRVNVVQGMAFLRGTVRSLAEKRQINLIVSKVLGIRNSFVKNVNVDDGMNISDQELERSIKFHLADILGENKRAITIHVDNKVAWVQGVVEDENERHKLEKAIVQQPGIVKINMDVRVKATVTSKYVSLAKKVEQKVQNIFEGVKFVSISITGENAEVSGTVRAEGDRSLVEKYLLQVLPVKHIDNKLYMGQ
jgi:osmotically-inducible protein OsmY